MTDLAALRSLYSRLDTLHAFVYFRPESGLNFAGLGFSGMASYFASRAAPLGQVTPATVTATFYNFSPATIDKAMDGLWAVASPEQVIETRFASADQALRAMLGDLVESAEMRRAAELLRRVAEAVETPGRPIAAANAALDWPDAPHLQVFHAMTILREYRGDAHVAALVLEGVGPLETLVLDVVAGRAKMAGAMVQATRGWSDDDWAAGFEALKQRGLISAEENLNDDGLALRERLEELTDEASLGVWSVLTDDEVAEVDELTRPWIRTVGAQMFGG